MPAPDITECPEHRDLYAAFAEAGRAALGSPEKRGAARVVHAGWTGEVLVRVPKAEQLRREAPGQPGSWRAALQVCQRVVVEGADEAEARAYLWRAWCCAADALVRPTFDGAIRPPFPDLVRSHWRVEDWRTDCADGFRRQGRWLAFHWAAIRPST